ncbi:MAG: hypothetical protein L6R41_006918 [Letrouitia leprolyta]|nr:MAG: hypothetical protein L6R41_006918 [Letrouitia leprolyta]
MQLVHVDTGHFFHIMSDADGNAEGDTIFVKTDCRTNIRLDTGQDSRYTGGILADTLDLSAFNSDGHLSQYSPLKLDSYQTCQAACHCGYSRGDVGDQFFKNVKADPGRRERALNFRLYDVSNAINKPYKACNNVNGPDSAYTCARILFQFYEDLVTSPFGVIDTNQSIPLTYQNITQLKHYGAIACDAPDGLGDIGIMWASRRRNTTMRTLPWHVIPDDDPTVRIKPFECFGNFTSIASVVNPYTQIAEGVAAKSWWYDSRDCIDESRSALQAFNNRTTFDPSDPMCWAFDICNVTRSESSASPCKLGLCKWVGNGTVVGDDDVYLDRQLHSDDGIGLDLFD